MNYYRFMRMFSLFMMAASIGAALGSFVSKEYGIAIFYVVSCGINHFCYNAWNKLINNTKTK